MPPPTIAQVRSLLSRFAQIDDSVIQNAITRAMRHVADYGDLPSQVQDEIALLLAGHFVELYELAPTSFSIGGDSVSYSWGGSVEDVFDMTLCGRQIKDLVRKHRVAIVSAEGTLSGYLEFF